MSIPLRASEQLESLRGRFHDGSGETAGLVAAVLDRCDGASARPAQARHLQRLIDAQAWTDVAFELVKRELPQWSIRRLAEDDGDWYCSLARCPAPPDWLDDDPVDGRGADISLAILDALVEAQRLSIADRSTPGRRDATRSSVLEPRLTPALRPSAG